MTPSAKILLRLLWGATLFGVIAGSVLPGTVLPGVGRFDKLFHFSGYAAVMFLPALHERWRSVLLCLAGSIALGVSLELAQTLMPGRYFELADIAANSWGALLGLSAGAILRPQVLPPGSNQSNLSRPS